MAPAAWRSVRPWQRRRWQYRPWHRGRHGWNMRGRGSRRHATPWFGRTRMTACGRRASSAAATAPGCPAPA